MALLSSLDSSRSVDGGGGFTLLSRAGQWLYYSSPLSTAVVVAAAVALLSSLDSSRNVDGGGGFTLLSRATVVLLLSSLLLSSLESRSGALLSSRAPQWEWQWWWRLYSVTWPYNPLDPAMAFPVAAA